MKCLNTNSRLLPRRKSVEKAAKRAPIKRAAIATVLLAAIIMLCSCSSQSSGPKARIHSSEEAIADLASRAVELGYDNALSELSPVRTTVSGGQSFHRLQQNYKGIPVCGQQVVYVTDEEGKCLTITHNVRDISEDLNITPSVSAETVDGYVNTYIRYELDMDKINDPVAVELTEENLRIYYDEVWEQFHLAYLVNWGSYQFLADAHTGQVLIHRALVQSAASTATLHTHGDSFQALQLSGGPYVLKDTEENIYIFDAGGKTAYKISANKLHPNRLSLVTSADNIFGNSDDSAEDPEVAENVFWVMRNIQLYYKETLGEQGFSNLMVIYNDKVGQSGGNSVGGVVSVAEYDLLFPELDTSKDGLLMGSVVLGIDHSNDILNRIDVAAHEYTHAVSWWHGGWNENNTENKVLNEAFSDIMGELIEAQLTGQDPDWIFLDRNIRDPHSSGMPVSVSDIYDMRNDTIHNRSTLISHTAYLMWNGMDGTESKKIPTEKLAELWYKSLLMMPSNADFSTCRSIVTEAAGLLDLTADQLSCIQEAFHNAEIWGLRDNVHATVDRTFKINVFGKTGTPLSRYEIIIEDASDYYGPYLPGKETIVFQATDKEPCYLTLDPGLYRICVTPHKSEESYRYLLRVLDSGTDNLDLYINYCFPTNFYCQVYTQYPTNMAVPNARVSICSLETGEPLVEMNTGPEGMEVTGEIFWGDYLLKVEADGYHPYEAPLQVTPLRASQNWIQLDPTEKPAETTYPAEPTEPYFEYPEIVTTQNDMDYGVYPFPKDFILEEFGCDGSDMYHVLDTDIYGYEEGGEQDTITTSSPYYWWWATFDPDVETQINDYIDLLSQEPFCLELIYTKDMGQEWVYVYRYTGKHTVYPLNISGFVPADAGEYHLAIDISKRADYHGRIALEVAAGYGLEAITPEILEDIRLEIGYNRTSNATGTAEEQESLDSGKCYFCYKTVYATAERPIYHEQIVYCDTCYAEMFG